MMSGVANSCIEEVSWQLEDNSELFNSSQFDLEGFKSSQTSGQKQVHFANNNNHSGDSNKGSFRQPPSAPQMGDATERNK